MRRNTLAALAVIFACLLGVPLAGCGAPAQTATGSVHPPGWGRPPAASLLTVTPTGPTGAMFDSVTLGAIPARPFAQAGYTAGRWPTYLPLRRAWPAAHTISIAVSAADHADCLDIEPGDATPAEAPGWVRADRAAGFATPCLYSSFFEFRDQVAPILARAGIARSSVFEWDADYTGVPHIDAGFDATQWTDRALGRNLDESMVTLRFLTIAQPPYRAPVPLPRCIHRRESVAACGLARNAIVHATYAAAASERAYLARGCDVLSARAAWFSGRLRAHPHVRAGYRRRALAATRRAIRQADCGMFAQRARYFAARASAIEAVN